MAGSWKRTFGLAVLGSVLLAGLVPAAHAQERDPAYEAARKAGQIGEKMDGYLGVVGNQSAAIADMVADLNIRRRENYAERAPRARPPATLQEYAITQGCILIARTVPGEKYQAPDGSWQTRDAGPPQRHSRCP
jgi:uncharacterized protein YdbL (DUF1318 family)